jgi:methionyl-tRNA formyltransferase
MLKVIVLTSSLRGTAANHLPALIESGCCQVVMVVHSRDVVRDKRKHYVRKLKKMLRIGLSGAMNGIRMRRWYHEDTDRYLPADPVNVTCAKHGIALHHVDAVNSDETRALFRQSGADLGISLGNGYIAKSVFSIPRLGMINIHHELLPEYQNAQSVIWQIYNNSNQTGYTIHRIESKIDAGAILYRQTMPIIFKESLADTVACTYAGLQRASAEGLVHTLRNFEELNKNAMPQGKGNSYTTPSLQQYLRILRNFERMKRWQAGGA